MQPAPAQAPPPLAAEQQTPYDEQNFRRSTAALDIYPESWERSYRETVAHQDQVSGIIQKVPYCGRPKLMALRPADFDMLKS